MDQDAALRKALGRPGHEGLSYGFEMRAMKEIMQEAETRRKWASIRWIAMISIVSAIMIAAAVLLLKVYFSFSFTLRMPRMNVSPEVGSSFGFYFYIAVLALILLGLDAGLRKRMHKPE